MCTNKLTIGLRDMANEEPVFSALLEVPFHAVQKNGRPVFNGRLVSNPRTQKAKRFLLPLLHRARLEHGIYDPIDNDLRCVLVFLYAQRDYFTRDQETKQLRRKQTVADAINLGELIQDCLQWSNIIKDDNQICDVRIVRKWGPRTEVKIELYPYTDEPLELSLWKNSNASSAK